MAYLEKHLKVKPSTLPGAGRGLFTSVSIIKGTRIIEYKGSISTWQEVEKDHDNFYLYKVSPQHVINAKEDLKALARYINDANGQKRLQGVTNNCKYVQEGLKIFIEALRDIPAGSELLVSYGHGYWHVVRSNLKK